MGDKPLFYSFKVGIENSSICIQVDDSSFDLIFQDCNKVEPIWSEVDFGYVITFKNIYNDIDISYHLKEHQIKEFIVIKSRKSQSEIKMKIKSEECFLFRNEGSKSCQVVDSDHVEIFSIPDPYVVHPHKNGGDMKRYVTSNFNIEEKLITYRFNHNLPQYFPVTVDPSFNFNTKALKNYGFLRDQFSKNNLMFITGATARETFVEENLTADLDGNYDLMSDDVLFENRIAIIFPWVLSGRATINIKRGKYESYYNTGTLTYVGDHSPVYSYVEIDLPFSNSGEIIVICKLDISPDVYSDLSVSFSRKLTYLPKVEVFFTDGLWLIQGNADRTITFDNLMVRNTIPFKPLNYYILPYDLDLTDEQRLRLVELDELKRSAVRIDAKSQSNFSAYFTFSEENVPSVNTSTFI